MVIQLITLSVRIAGGITLFSIFYAGFLFTTSFGDKNRIAQSRELFFNSLVYLLVVILAVAIINFLGVRVLNLNAFGFLV
jgi:heme O synthase-like polyprenyltransferase